MVPRGAKAMVGQGPKVRTSLQRGQRIKYGEVRRSARNLLHPWQRTLSSRVLLQNTHTFCFHSGGSIVMANPSGSISIPSSTPRSRGPSHRPPRGPEVHPIVHPEVPRSIPSSTPRSRGPSHRPPRGPEVHPIVHPDFVVVLLKENSTTQQTKYT